MLGLGSGSGLGLGSGSGSGLGVRVRVRVRVVLVRVGRVLEVVALDEVAELEAVELGGHALVLELRWGQI